MSDRTIVGLWVVSVICISFALSMQLSTSAAGPSHELQVGQTHREKGGWIQDTKGYWFHEQNAMAYRVAQKMPEAPHPITAPATERVQR